MFFISIFIAYLWLMINQERLRIRVKKKILTQKDIAALAEIEETKFSRWSKGVVSLKEDEAARLKEVLK